MTFINAGLPLLQTILRNKKTCSPLRHRCYTVFSKFLSGEFKVDRFKHLLTSPNFWTVAVGAMAVWVCFAGYFSFLIETDFKKISSFFLILTVLAYVGSSAIALLLIKKLGKGRGFVWLFALVLGSCFFGTGSYFILLDLYTTASFTGAALYIAILTATIFRIMWAVLETALVKNTEQMIIFDKQHQG